MEPKHLRKKKVIDNLMANGGNKKKAMIDAGYSPSYAKNSHKTKESKSWNDLMDEYLPDDYLIKEQKKLTNARSITQLRFAKTETTESIKRAIKRMKGEYIGQDTMKDNQGNEYIEVTALVPDKKLRKEMLDMAHKLKGTYAAEKVAIVDPVKEMSDEELDRAIKEAESRK